LHGEGEVSPLLKSINRGEGILGRKERGEYGETLLKFLMNGYLHEMA
jgi:hypothetical protein